MSIWSPSWWEISAVCSYRIFRAKATWNTRPENSASNWKPTGSVAVKSLTKSNVWSRKVINLKRRKDRLKFCWKSYPTSLAPCLNSKRFGSTSKRTPTAPATPTPPLKSPSTAKKKSPPPRGTGRSVPSTTLCAKRCINFIRISRICG